MKKNIIYLLIAGCSLFLGACNDDDTQYLPPVELQITSSTVDFKSVGGDGTIEVGNADPTLTATSNEEWCTIKACSNGVVSFYIAPNDEMETRTATISLVMGESSAKIGITQMGIITNYKTDDFFSFAENKAFKQFIRFESEMPITVSISEEAQTWLSYEEAENGYYILADENTESLERLGKVTLESGSLAKEYSFMQ